MSKKIQNVFLRLKKIYFIFNVSELSPLNIVTVNEIIIHMSYILGDSGGVVNSLDFCPASLKLLLLPVRTFFTMEGDSEFADFTLPTLKALFEALSHNVSGNKQ